MKLEHIRRFSATGFRGYLNTLRILVCGNNGFLLNYYVPKGFYLFFCHRMLGLVMNWARVATLGVKESARYIVIRLWIWNILSFLITCHPELQKVSVSWNGWLPSGSFTHKTIHMELQSHLVINGLFNIF